MLHAGCAQIHLPLKGAGKNPKGFRKKLADAAPQVNAHRSYFGLAKSSGYGK
jgi:hypothetical protein